MTTRKGKSTEQRNFKVKEPGRRKGDPQGNPAKDARVETRYAET
jgi:hypothetical protein